MGWGRVRAAGLSSAIPLTSGGGTSKLAKRIQNPYEIHDEEEQANAGWRACTVKGSGEGGAEARKLLRLLDTLRTLRGEGGCPWDREQTLDSMTPYIIEEAYEVVDAVAASDRGRLKVEIGDLLFLLLFMSEIAASEGSFDLGEVLSACNEKMVRRHPHVFGHREAKLTSDACRTWEQVKQTVESSSFGEQPLGTLPALVSAYRVQEKAAAFGFDWDEPLSVASKIREELDEVSACLQNESRSAGALEEEIGDLLFSVVNLARFMKLDPERILRRTVNKFSARLRYIDRKLAEDGKRPESATLEEMEELWQRSKTEELDY